MGIAVYLVVLVAIAALSYFFLIAPSQHHSVKTTTITGANYSSTTTVTGQFSTTTANVTTTTINYGSCVSKTENVSLLNGNFSYGTYYWWNVTGYGFNDTEFGMDGPLNITYANANRDYYNVTWRGYNGNFFATTYQVGLNLRTGNLTSKPFLVTEPYLNFKIISPSDAGLYVVLLDNGKPYLTTYYNTYDLPNEKYATSTFYNASLPVAGIICQNASIKVVADVVGSAVNREDYIAIGDFYLSKNPVATASIVVNQTVG